MTARTRSPLVRVLHRIRELWAELDYAQARLLEIRTGVPGLTRRSRSAQAAIDELERLYALESAPCDDVVS
jgi:hypothetical protein